MRKRFWMSALFACGLSLAAFAAPQDKALFDATIKHVDMGGEMLQYQNTRALQEIVDKIPAVVKIFAEGEPMAPTIDSAVQSVIKLLNIKAIKAGAASSVEVAPGIYCLKDFILVDMQAKALFIDPDMPNTILDWQGLPADTRIAIKQYVNLNRIWQMVYNEIKNNQDPQIRQLADMIDAVRQQQGIDIHALFASFDGDVEILLTGTSLEDAAAKVVIPDKNGSISALLKIVAPPQGDSNIATVPTPVANIKVIYEQGKITAVSNEKLLAEPVETLGDKAEYKKYARILPERGYGYCIVDLPAELINMGKAAIGDEKELLAVIDMFIRPVSIVCVGSTKKDGFAATVASNFSIAQLMQSFSGAAASLPTLAGMILPALNAARDRGKQVNCISNLKQFGVAVMVYGADHDDKAPASIDDLVKDNTYIQEDVCEDIIFLAPGKKLFGNFNPSTFPIAICDRCSHNENQVDILYADGHVSSMPVSADADEEDIIRTIAEQGNLSQADTDFLLKQLGE